MLPRQSYNDWHLFNTLWANIAYDKLIVFFLISPENLIWYFMQIVSSGDDLQEMSSPIFWENEENNNKATKCRLLNFLPSMLRVIINYIPNIVSSPVLLANCVDKFWNKKQKQFSWEMDTLFLSSFWKEIFCAGEQTRSQSVFSL